MDSTRYFSDVLLASVLNRIPVRAVTSSNRKSAFGALNEVKTRETNGTALNKRTAERLTLFESFLQPGNHRLLVGVEARVVFPIHDTVHAVLNSDELDGDAS